MKSEASRIVVTSWRIWFKFPFSGLAWRSFRVSESSYRGCEILGFEGAAESCICFFWLPTASSISFSTSPHSIPLNLIVDKMLVLVGPESVTSPCIGSSGSARALDPQIGKFSLQRGKSRVRLVRAGIGMRKMENLRIRVLSRRLHCDQFSPRPAIQSRRVVRYAISASSFSKTCPTLRILLW